MFDKTFTLQTLPQKKKEMFSNTNVIKPGMYSVKVTDKQEKQKETNESVLTFTGLEARRALFTSPLDAKTRVVDVTPLAVRTSLVGDTPMNANDKASSSTLKSPESTKVSSPNSGCSKHMTGNLKLLKNFVEKFMGNVCFKNDQFAAITSYGDYVYGNIVIFHVYYVEGLGHNLFSIGEICDGDLEVAFR
ncbi:hypothetical protein Tco_0462717 [Tanacetum coccineum]